VGLAAAIALIAPGGCKRADETEPKARPVVYCSVDETFARVVLKVFKTRTGIELDIVFDSEAGKTTGLVNRIIAEAAAGRPRADVFWSSEIFNTILLGRQGLLEPYDSPAAADIPPRYRDAQHRWTATATRARVLAFDPARTPRTQVPIRWEQLAEPPFAARATLANPLFGTTRGHVAAMFALWGPGRARAFLTQLRDGGMHLADSNGATVRAVISERADLAATDTDDVWVAQRGGYSLDLAYPDMGDGGTLLIPCSVAIVKGAPHPEAARKLVDFLVSAEVEQMLAQSDSRNIPVRQEVRDRLGLTLPAASAISFDAVADAMNEAVAAVRDILIR
jgi:iron(III) transport system substrate-binding protein